jgi:hypothetical protein
MIVSKTARIKDEVGFVSTKYNFWDYFNGGNFNRPTHNRANTLVGNDDRFLYHG